MADELRLQLSGIDELKQALRAVPDALRKRVLRNALAVAGREIRDAARAAAPVLKSPARRRTPGTIKSNIVVRTSKRARQAGDVGVFVSVRPLRGAREKKLGRRGAENPRDPYYWWWQEFGWTPAGRRAINVTAKTRSLNRAAPRRIQGRRFITNAARDRGESAIATFMKAVVPQIEKLNHKGALGVR